MNSYVYILNSTHFYALLLGKRFVLLEKVFVCLFVCFFFFFFIEENNNDYWLFILYIIYVGVV